MAETLQTTKPDAVAVLKEAVDRADVPKIYANAFTLGLTNADIIIVFQRFGTNPAAVVNLSYTLAKTLAQRLGRLVSEFESAIGDQNILTTDRIDEALRKAQGKSQPETESDDKVH